MAILCELNDTSLYIEYWCRQKWRHIEAHTDADSWSCPVFASGTRRERSYVYLCRLHQCIVDLADNNKPEIALVTAPAVEGCLLRFTGSLLHAVPRPTDIWLLPFVQGTPARFQSVALRTKCRLVQYMARTAVGSTATARGTTTRVSSNGCNLS